MTSLCRGRTKSGCPGKSRRCSLKRKPIACRNLLTASSGWVLDDRMRDISALRFGSTTNAFSEKSTCLLAACLRGLPTHSAVAFNILPDARCDSLCKWRRHRLAHLRDLRGEGSEKLIFGWEPLKQKSLIN
jgi:hypothetical protein